MAASLPWLESRSERKRYEATLATYRERLNEVQRMAHDFWQQVLPSGEPLRR